MQEKFALYKDRFPTWAEHSSAMLQYANWVTLESEGLGANLQHYNPLIDERVAAEWKVPSNWQLTAQLVFGGRAGEAGPKDHLPLEETFKVAKALSLLGFRVLDDDKFFNDVSHTACRLGGCGTQY